MNRLWQAYLLCLRTGKASTRQKSGLQAVQAFYSIFNRPVFCRAMLAVFHRLLVIRRITLQSPRYPLNATKNIGKHFLSQPFGLHVIAAAMIRIDQRTPIRQGMLRVMSEFGAT